MFENLRLRALTRFAAKRSRTVITGSGYSRDDIISSYGIDPEKVAVVPYGVSPLFSPEKDADRTQRVLERHGIRQPYILFVGRLNPRKNLKSLSSIFLELKKKAFPHQLVIVGKQDYKSEEIVQTVGKSNFSDSIIFTGFVPDGDLPFLYQGAELFVYISLFEGVGLPVLEAMSSGLPVLTSNTTSLREIVGDAGVTVNPQNRKEIQQALLRLLEDKELRNGYIQKGFSRAAPFTWEATARATLDIYRQVFAQTF